MSETAVARGFGSRAILVAVMAASAVIAVIQLAEYFVGLTLRIPDVTHHSQLVVRHFFQTSSLWYDFCCNGLSLLANPTYQLFYPPHYLYNVLPFPVVERLVVLLHYPMLACGLLLWARRLEVKDHVAAPMVLLFIASGLTQSLVYRSTIYFYSIVWIPLAVVLAIDARRCSSIWRAGAAGAAVASIITAGDLFMSGFATLVIAAALIAEVKRGGSRLGAAKARSWRSLAMFGAAGLAYLSVCGFILLHAQQFFVLSSRASGLPTSHVEKHSLHPFRIVEFFADIFNPGEILASVGSQTLRGAEWWFPSIYFGPAALLLVVPATVAILRQRRLRPYAWAGAAFLFFALGKYNPVATWLIEQVPAVRVFRYPEKLLVPAVICGFPLMLAGFAGALEWLSIRLRRVFSARALYGSLVLLLLAPAVWHAAILRYYAPGSLKRPQVLQALEQAPSTTRRFLNTLNGYPESPFKDAALPVMLNYGTAFWGESDYFCADSTLNEIELSLSEAMFSKFASREIREAAGTSHIVWPEVDQGAVSAAIRNGELRVAARSPDDPVVIVEDPLPITRAGLLTSWLIKPASGGTADELRENLSLRDGRARLLPTGVIEPSGLVSRESTLPSTWTPSGQTSDKCQPRLAGDFVPPMTPSHFEVDAGCPTLLYVNARFVGGWRAEVDGRPSWIGRINGLLLGIPVPKGHHTVKIWFEPPFFRGFFELSLAVQTLLFLCVAIIAVRPMPPCREG